MFQWFNNFILLGISIDGLYSCKIKIKMIEIKSEKEKKFKKTGDNNNIKLEKLGFDWLN